MNNKMTASTTGSSIWKEVQEVAAEWERDGWLRKLTIRGQEHWQLTPLGRRELAKEKAREQGRAATLAATH
jgi:hypothetical protein